MSAAASSSSSLEITILQGAPGSGKSTYAAVSRLRSDVVVCNTDEFFTVGDVYDFNGAMLSEAHVWNQARAYESLTDRRSVIVDNTNIFRWNAIPYVRMGIELNALVRFHRCIGEFENTNGVKQGVDENHTGGVTWQRKEMEPLTVASVLTESEPDFVVEANKIGPTVANLLTAKLMMAKAGYPFASGEMPKPVWPDHSVPFVCNGFVHHISAGKRYVCYLPGQGIHAHTHDKCEIFHVTTGEAALVTTSTSVITNKEEEYHKVCGAGSTMSASVGTIHYVKASVQGCCFYEEKDVAKSRKTVFILNF